MADGEHIYPRLMTPTCVSCRVGGAKSVIARVPTALSVRVSHLLDGKHESHCLVFIHYIFRGCYGAYFERERASQMASKSQTNTQHIIFNERGNVQTHTRCCLMRYLV